MADTTTHQGFNRLKELLLDQEQASLSSLRSRLDTVTGRLDTLHDRLGTEARLTTSVADVLDRALREAEVKHHEQLAGAVAPLVVKTIKTELRNSQDEMVEALYPITGRMVKSYVTSALRDLTEQINRRLEQNALMLRLKSLTTGRSVADLAIAETQHLTVEEVFLIRRGVGELIARYPDNRPGAAPTNSDVQFSGLLTAINDFASEAFVNDGGAIRSFKFDDFQVYLRASPQYLIAVRCRGVAPPGIETIIEEEFIERLGQAPAGDDATKAALPHLAEALERRGKEAQQEFSRAGLGFNPLKALLLLVVALLCGWFAWNWLIDWRIADVRQKATVAVTETSGLEGYPTKINVTSRGRAVSLTGLAPDHATRTDALNRLRSALPDVAISEHLSVLPKPSNAAEVEVARVRDQLANLETELTRTAIARLLARAETRIDQTVAELERIATGLDASEKRQSVMRLKDELSTVAGELTGYRRAANAKDKGDEIADLSGVFAGVTHKLEVITAGLASLIGSGSAAAPAAPQDRDPPPNAHTAAEGLAAAAERAQMLAVAVAQASRIKPVIVAAPAPPPPAVPPITPTQRIADWVRENAVFFSNGTELRDPVITGRNLDRLAELLAGTETRIRVIGYTDERGDARRNAALATERAEMVARLLIERGVPADRLIAIGRTTGSELSQRSGPDSPNRRVEFEFAFRNELGSASR